MSLRSSLESTSEDQRPCQKIFQNFFTKLLYMDSIDSIDSSNIRYIN